MASDPILLGHKFPTYRVRNDPDESGMLLAAEPSPTGDYVHEMHAQALSERVILAREALKQGRTGDARATLDEAYAYLKRPTHTR